ncbi:hypothetical protein GCM10009660_21850 [Catellatospora bangladeshensis]
MTRREVADLLAEIGRALDFPSDHPARGWWAFHDYHLEADRLERGRSRPSWTVKSRSPRACGPSIPWAAPRSRGTEPAGGPRHLADSLSRGCGSVAGRGARSSATVLGT